MDAGCLLFVSGWSEMKIPFQRGFWIKVTDCELRDSRICSFFWMPGIDVRFKKK